MKSLIPFCTALVGFAVGMWSTDSTEVPVVHLKAPVPTTSEPERPDALAEILTALRMKPGLRQFAAMSEPMSRLTSEQMGKLIERTQRDSIETWEHHSGWLFKWWLERDPAAASAWFQPRLRLFAQDGSVFGFSSNSDTEMIGAWAKAFPDDALNLAREFPDSGLASSLIYPILAQRKSQPENELWPILRDLPEGKGRAKQTERFMAKWGKKDAASAFAAAAALAPGRTRDAALVVVLPELAATDAKLAFEQYNKLGLADPELVTKMIAGAATKDPAGIAEWLTTLDAVQFTQAAPSLVETWAAKDPAAALAWAAAHNVPLVVGRDFLGNTEITHHGFTRSMGHRTDTNAYNSLATAMGYQSAATLTWFYSLPAGPERDRMASRLLSVATADQAIRLFDELPPEARRDAASTVAWKLSAKPKDATAWIDKLPSGPVREQVWYALGQQAANKFDPPVGPDRDAFLRGKIFLIGLQAAPTDALDLTLEINNPTKRREVLDSIMEKQTRDATSDSASKSREWIEKANLPDEWKAKWRTK